MRTFWTVQNRPDLSGLNTPFKMPYFPQLVTPAVIPVPITKTPSYTVPMGQPSMSNFFPDPFTPRAQVNLTDKPFKSQVIGMTNTVAGPFGGITTQYGNPSMYPGMINTFGSPYGNMSTRYPYPNPYTYGVPIIKRGPIIASGMPGVIKITFGDTVITIRIPYEYFGSSVGAYRGVIARLLEVASKPDDAGEKKIEFIVTATGVPSTPITTTYSKMMGVVNYIKNTFGGVTYELNGNAANFNDLYAKASTSIPI